MGFQLARVAEVPRSQTSQTRSQGTGLTREPFWWNAISFPLANHLFTFSLNGKMVWHRIPSRDIQTVQLSWVHSSIISPSAPQGVEGTVSRGCCYPPTPPTPRPAPALRPPPPSPSLTVWSQPGRTDLPSSAAPDPGLGRPNPPAVPQGPPGLARLHGGVRTRG